MFLNPRESEFNYRSDLDNDCNMVSFECNSLGERLRANKAASKLHQMGQGVIVVNNVFNTQLWVKEAYALATGLYIRFGGRYVIKDAPHINDGQELSY